MYIIYKNFERRFSFHETHTRSPRGGLTMGRTAAGRSELAELADDSAFSADASIPPSPRGARSMTGRQSVPLFLESGEEVAVGNRVRACKTLNRT